MSGPRLLVLVAVAMLLPAMAQAAPRRIADPSTPEARLAVDRAAACLVGNSPEVAAEMLAMDFRSTAYRRKMDFLFDANRGCVKARWIKVNRLLVAGAVAEHLVERGETPLNARLVRVAPTSVATPRTPSDAAAFCVARSDPDGVAHLFATAPGSGEETAAAEALAPALGLCAQGRPLSVSPAGLRSMVATASFRLLAAAEGES